MNTEIPRAPRLPAYVRAGDDALEVDVSDEDRDMWRVYLDKGEFRAALVHCRRHARARAPVACSLPLEFFAGQQHGLMPVHDTDWCPFTAWVGVRSQPATPMLHGASAHPRVQRCTAQLCLPCPGGLPV